MQLPFITFLLCQLEINKALCFCQVYYRDKTFAMGHVINRIKQEIGHNLQKIPLLRCIQNMNQDHPYNTCYTAGMFPSTRSSFHYYGIHFSQYE